MAASNQSSQFLYDGFLNDTKVNLTLGHPHWNFSSDTFGNWSSYGNWSGSWDDKLFDRIHIRVIFSILYGIVCMTCVFGNGLVIFVILRHKKMRSITNFFLANLAFADLCVGVFCVIPTLMSFLTQYWYFGMVMCKLQHFVQCASYTASIAILTVISIERYFAIIHPMLSKRFSRMCLMRIIVGIVWLIAIIYATPMLISHGTISIKSKSLAGNENETVYVHFCLKTKPLAMGAYVLVNFLLGYLLPLVLMIVMYTKVSIFLWRSSNMLGDKTVNGAVGMRKHRARSLNLAERDYTVDSDGMTYATGSTMLSTDASLLHATRNKRLPYVFLSRVDLEDAGRRGSANSAGRRMSANIGNSTPRRGSRDTLKKRNTDSLIGIDKAVAMSLLHPHDCLAMNGNQRRKSIIPMSGALARSYSQPNDLNEVVKPSKLSTLQAMSQSQQVLHGGPAGKRRGSRLSISSRASRLSAQFDMLNLSRTSLGRLDSFSFACTRPQKTKVTNPLSVRRKVIRLLIVIVIVFALCVLPHHIRLVWQFWGGHSHATNHHRVFPPLASLFFYMNNCLNPFLYAFLSDNFRKAFGDIKRSFRGRKRYGQSTRGPRMASIRRMQGPPRA